MSVSMQGISYSDPGFVPFHQRKKLMQAFWVGAWSLLIFTVVINESSKIESILGAALIGIAVLVPVYLWCSGRVPGMPIFPIFAMPHLWTYALPLITNHPSAIIYSPEQHLFAGLTIASFLGLGTAVWYKVSAIPIAPPVSCWALQSTKSDSFFLNSLIAYSLMVMGLVGGWFDFMGAWMAVPRSVAFALGNLSVFVLAYRFGKKELPAGLTRSFLILLCLLIISNAASLLLVGSISILFLAALGFVLGSRKVPWLPLLLGLAFMAALHYGKATMRQMYMYGDEYRRVQPWEYVGWFGEWVHHSLGAVLSQDSSSGSPQQSLLARAGLSHILLMVQQLSPHHVPYLAGATYAVIPRLLVPRFINPDREGTHEGTSLLNIHYGKQTREDTHQTTIGWGLLNEAYANFGFFGSILLGILLGGFYGGIARWSSNSPILSARSLFSVLVLSFAYQTEFSAGIYVTALLHSTLPLILVAVLFMKDQVNPEYTVVGRQPLGTTPVL